MGERNPNQLVVEDTDIKGAVIGLAKRRIKAWPEDRTQVPFWIRVHNSADQTLDPDTLAVLFKEEGRTALGVVVDADDAFASRWARIQKFARKHFNSVPKSMPKEGLVLTSPEGKRFGAWIMPDNESKGMLEDFCRTLIPEGRSPLWTFAQRATREAKVGHGADYKEAHVAKADMRSWLAWRDPPGEQMGVAIAKRILDPDAPTATTFATWLAKLYQLQLEA